jgi:hypothetical protein
MSTVDVKLTFPGTKLPDEDIFMAVIPQVGDVVWTTEAFLGHGEDDSWEQAASWKVQSLNYFLHRTKTVVLVELRAYTGEPESSRVIRVPGG